ncbi:MAG: hypothetical protein ACFFED_01560 [Candidatus Thorarchaeota archaeon]
MQTFVSTFSFVIVLIALVIQMIWISLARKARDTYLGDLASFRKPSSTLSRYYKWRMDCVRNTVIDGIVFSSVLLVTIVTMVSVSISMDNLLAFLPVILFVIGISILTMIQSAYRVSESTKKERQLLDHLEPAQDKIGVAKGIALDLISSDKKEDGRIWYILYRIAQRQDSIGWSVRDVLLNKGLKNDASSLEPGAPSRGYGSRDPDTGPGIS